MNLGKIVIVLITFLLALLAKDVVLTSIFLIFVARLAVLTLSKEFPVVLFVFSYSFIQICSTWFLFLNSLIFEEDNVYGYNAATDSVAIQAFLLLIFYTALVYPVKRSRTFLHFNSWIRVYSVSLIIRYLIIPSIGGQLGASLYFIGLGLLLIALGLILESKKRGVLLVVVAFEVTLGMVSYFSSFKVIFFLLIIALIRQRYNDITISKQSINPKSLLKTVPIVIVGLTMVISMAIWLNMKEDYRSFLNEGSSMQVVRQSKTEAIKKFISLAGKAEIDKNTAYRALNRLSYGGYFSHLYERKVDAHHSHLLEALGHVTKPRFLFPSKKILDDSVQANLYLKQRVAGSAQGTSISLGYLSELWIEFGFLSFAIIGVMGLLFGRLFWLVTNYTVLSTYIVSMIIIYPLYTVEISLAKLMGVLIANSLVVLLLFNERTKRIWRYFT